MASLNRLRDPIKRQYKLQRYLKWRQVGAFSATPYKKKNFTVHIEPTTENQILNALDLLDTIYSSFRGLKVYDYPYTCHNVIVATYKKRIYISSQRKNLRDLEELQKALHNIIRAIKVLDEKGLDLPDYVEKVYINADDLNEAYLCYVNAIAKMTEKTGIIKRISLGYDRITWIAISTHDQSPYTTSFLIDNNLENLRRLFIWMTVLAHRSNIEKYIKQIVPYGCDVRIGIRYDLRVTVHIERSNGNYEYFRTGNLFEMKDLIEDIRHWAKLCSERIEKLGKMQLQLEEEIDRIRRTYPTIDIHYYPGVYHFRYDGKIREDDMEEPFAKIWKSDSLAPTFYAPILRPGDKWDGHGYIRTIIKQKNQVVEELKTPIHYELYQKLFDVVYAYEPKPPEYVVYNWTPDEVSYAEYAITSELIKHRVEGLYIIPYARKYRHEIKLPLTRKISKYGLYRRIKETEKAVWYEPIDEEIDRILRKEVI